MSNSYIGSRISVTTATKQRYEGILTDINVTTSTVTLSNGSCSMKVNSFGTEGRTANMVPASNQVIPKMTFHRADIEELVVVENAQAAAPVQQEPSYDYQAQTSQQPGYGPYGQSPYGSQQPQQFQAPNPAYMQYYYQQLQAQLHHMSMNPGQWDPQHQQMLMMQLQAMNAYFYQQHQQQQQQPPHGHAAPHMSAGPATAPASVAAPTAAPVATAPATATPVSETKPTTTAAAQATAPATTAPAAGPESAAPARSIGAPTTTAATPAASSASTTSTNAAPARSRTDPWGTAKNTTAKTTAATSSSSATPSTAPAATTAPAAKPAWNQIVAGTSRTTTAASANGSATSASATSGSHGRVGGTRGRSAASHGSTGATHTHQATQSHSNSNHGSSQGGQRTGGGGGYRGEGSGGRGGHRGGHHAGSGHRTHDEYASHTGVFTGTTGHVPPVLGATMEFDFDAAAAAFDKKKLVDELFGSVSAPKGTTSFYDDFGIDPNGEDSRQRDRSNRDTFADTTTGLSSGGGRGRGGHRGGRGGGGGRSNDTTSSSSTSTSGDLVNTHHGQGSRSGAPRKDYQQSNRGGHQQGGSRHQPVRANRTPNQSSQTFRPRTTPHD